MILLITFWPFFPRIEQVGKKRRRATEKKRKKKGEKKREREKTKKDTNRVNKEIPG